MARDHRWVIPAVAYETAMRPDLFAMAPERIKRLPVDPERKYPVPYFVPWIDGKPEFRATFRETHIDCIDRRVCWVCGEPLGRFLSFVIGPMCTVNRISAEPPQHRDCSEFSAKACPFLVKPQMVRREMDRPEGIKRDPAMLEHNPGACVVYTTVSFRLVPHNGAISIGLAIRSAWHGLRKASRQTVSK